MKYIKILTIALQDFVNRMFSIEGRTSRRNFRWAYLAFAKLWYFTPDSLLMNITFQLLTATLYIRRFQDSNRSKKIPLLSSILIIIFCIIDEYLSANPSISGELGFSEHIMLAAFIVCVLVTFIYTHVICFILRGSEGENDYGMPNELPTPQEA